MKARLSILLFLALAVVYSFSVQAGTWSCESMTTVKGMFCPFTGLEMPVFSSENADASRDYSDYIQEIEGLQSPANVMKNRTDTAKNSIRNIN